MGYRKRIFICPSCGTKYGIDMSIVDFVCPDCVTANNQIKHANRSSPYSVYEYEDRTFGKYVRFVEDFSEDEWRKLRRHQRRFAP